MPPFQPPATLLIIAQSARMLVQLAVAAGYYSIAVDCFADMDTLQLAMSCKRVNDLSLAELKPAIAKLQKHHTFNYIIYGSGFEAFPESLEFLAAQGLLLGTAPLVFQRLLDKPDFFKQLTQLGITYPHSLFCKPIETKNYLFKPFYSQGGQEIRFISVTDDAAINMGYWQQYLPGQPMSVTFLACNNQFRILGYNHQWTHAIDDQEFLFAGVANGAELSLQNQALLSRVLEKLLPVYSLQGLASLDFIVLDEQCYLLEINARPPASAQLYGADVFNWHMQACLGSLPTLSTQATTPCAYQIVFAAFTIQIPDDIQWPDWVHDIPAAGVIIGKGQPICSIIAAENTVQQLSDQLLYRQHLIENILKTGSYQHAISG
ncbi:ATP-grasp domain-containing protein [Methylomonas sp. AM2-LC]|uniref:ATP-grasp domain-containing protein n=1 Tax=Methylomonas sp. AM2-LC TaxID=3153301 RepID=UPI003263BD9C